MIFGIGNDIVEIKRIEKLLKKHNEKFKQWVYTENEIAYCEKKNKNKAESYAARFCAKEAVSKAIGKGIGSEAAFKDIEVVNNSDGKPELVLHGKLKDKYNNYNFHISLTHCIDYASAFVVIEEK